MPPHKTLLGKPIDHSHRGAVINGEDSSSALFDYRNDDLIAYKLVSLYFRDAIELRTYNVRKFVFGFRKKVGKYLLRRRVERRTHPTSAVLSDAGYSAKRVTLSLAL